MHGYSITLAIYGIVSKAVMQYLVWTEDGEAQEEEEDDIVDKLFEGVDFGSDGNKRGRSKTSKTDKKKKKKSGSKRRRRSTSSSVSEPSSSASGSSTSSGKVGGWVGRGFSQVRWVDGFYIKFLWMMHACMQCVWHMNTYDAMQAQCTSGCPMVCQKKKKSKKSKKAKKEKKERKPKDTKPHSEGEEVKETEEERLKREKKERAELAKEEERKKKAELKEILTKPRQARTSSIAHMHDSVGTFEFVHVIGTCIDLQLLSGTHTIERFNCESPGHWWKS